LKRGGLLRRCVFWPSVAALTKPSFAASKLFRSIKTGRFNRDLRLDNSPGAK